jgi:hypothetical protein
MPAFAFQHSLTGGFALSPDAHRAAQPMAVTLSARAGSLGELWRERGFAVSGRLDARGLAQSRPLAGRLRVTRAALEYDLTFDDDRGRRCALRASQELSFRGPPAGFSVVAGTISHEGREIAAAELRLDPRSDLRRLLQSITISFVPTRCALRARPRPEAVRSRAGTGHKET